MEKTKHWKETTRLEKEKVANLVCYYCGGLVDEKKKTKFCCSQHAVLFKNAKRVGRKIGIKINDKTTIYTNKYDCIPEVIAKQKQFIENSRL